jgi:hypothetical protein
MDNETLDFLASEANLLSHLQAQLTGLSPYQIGHRFARFVQYLYPYTEVGASFKLPQLRQESHDGGVDMEAEPKSGAKSAYIQSKYSIRSVDEVDQIFSKFQSFEAKNKNVPQASLFEDVNAPNELPIYVIFTASKIGSLVDRYKVSGRPSVNFFQKLVENEQIFLIDSGRLYAALLSAYKRSTQLPESVDLTFDTPYLRDGEVLIGITSVARIRELYEEFGDALFLENIREWLGPHGGKQVKGTRESPNQAISKTLHEAPQRFLARNNGLTFRAKKITVLANDRVILSEASIVNGCQTTMSIVDAGGGVAAKVVVKVVETDDSWDIAQAANFQTTLDRMELELARDLRPQIIRAQAQKTGMKFVSASGHRTAFSVVEELYDEAIVYEEFRSLFVGLFSRNPSNSFLNNYSELRQDLLASLQIFEEKDAFYEKLFRIQLETRKGAAKQFEAIDGTNIGELFQRFWKEEKANYRSYISLLALAYIAGDDVGLPISNFKEMTIFIDSVLRRIDTNSDALQNAYSYAFKAIALLVLHKHQDKQEQLQAMFREIQNAKFENLLNQVKLIAT